jgi:membrane associated rhomboid family serine protease
MIILPTEKRFNWNNPPFILCLLVFLNVCIFFFYQSGDEEKINESARIYLDAGLLKKEWKSYINYLELLDQSERAERFKEYYKEDYKYFLSGYILQDKAFAAHIESKKQEIYGEKHADDLWKKRQQASEIMYSNSNMRFGLVPNDIDIISIFSSQFLHGDTMHLLGNMFFLIVCGFAVEAAIGHWYFLLFYLLSGIAGGLGFALMDLNSSTPLIGASGAISGVMAMYLCVFRLKKIEFFYWFYVFVGYVRLPALIVLPLYIGMELFYFFFDKDSNTAFMAHAGGFVSASILMGGLLLWKPETLDEEYIEEDHSINPYQQKLALVYTAMESFQFPLAEKHLQEVLAEYEETFPLLLLQYHLMKSRRNDEYEKLVKKILDYTKLNFAELHRQDQVFTENIDIAKKLPEEKLIRMGMRFAALEGMRSAELIFSILKDYNSRNNMTGIFARKLAVNFEATMCPEKSAYYSNKADAIMQGDPL